MSRDVSAMLQQAWMCVFVHQIVCTVYVELQRSACISCSCISPAARLAVIAAGSL
jgi:hypothetical protein